MDEDIKQLRAYIAKLDLDPKIADVYAALLAHGSQTISELARSSGVGRIPIYRLTEDLKKSGLVKVSIENKRSILSAASINKLQVLIANKEQELQDIQREYPKLAARFALRAQAMQSSTTRVQFFEGIEGIKQVVWNQTKAKGETLTILSDNMQHHVNSAFFERWVRACNESGMRFRGIVGDAFLGRQKGWYADHSNERLAHWDARYISPQKFPVPHTLAIFDDTILQYSWNTERLFAIEMHNQNIADMQRQLFELLWAQAESMEDPWGVVGSTS
jgi:sugar-specific transcriptional regulator TrmB